MAAHDRPIWILVDGHHPVALATLKRKRFPAGVKYWCHSGDPTWSPLNDDDRARLERRTGRKKRCRKEDDA